MTKRKTFESNAIKRACLMGTDQDLNWNLKPKLNGLKKTIRDAEIELIEVEAAIGENRIEYKEIYDTPVIKQETENG